jgi:hypothetical protein
LLTGKAGGLQYKPYLKLSDMPLRKKFITFELFAASLTIVFIVIRKVTGILFAVHLGTGPRKSNRAFNFGFGFANPGGATLTGRVA